VLGRPAPRYPPTVSPRHLSHRDSWCSPSGVICRRNPSLPVWLRANPGATAAWATTKPLNSRACAVHRYQRNAGRL